MSYAISSRLSGQRDICFTDPVPDLGSLQANTLLTSRRSMTAAAWFIRRQLGIAAGQRMPYSWIDDVGSLLDCSGFQYGDPWLRNENYHRARIHLREHIIERGGLVIFLPQSFGPFHCTSRNPTWMRLFDQASLIFARDRLSLEHIRDFSRGHFDDARIRLAPDFTNLVDAIYPTNVTEWTERVCIVPNARMTDMTAQGVGERYVNFLVAAIRSIQHRGLEPIVLIHESGDHRLANELCKRSPLPPRILDPGPREAKGILASCRAVLASRYHALIGVLSQGRPVIGTSWTHKYGALFEDYGVKELLLPTFCLRAFDDRLDTLLEEGESGEFTKRIQESGRSIRIQTKKMWSEVEACLNHGRVD